MTRFFLMLSLAACNPQPDRPMDDEPVDTDTSDTDDTGTAAVVGLCDVLPEPTGDVVNISPSDDLEAALEALTTGQTALLAAGTYALASDAYISLRADGVTVRGATGRAEDVVIDGNWQTQFGLSVNASDVVISDLTLQRFYYHPVHVTPSAGRSISGVRLYRLRIIDGAEQAIKINTGDNGTLFADDGEVACSHLELTDDGRPHVRNNCYTGGVDAHQARGWGIRDNHIEGFWCDSGLSEHGVHFWRGGRDTVIERNTLVNNARGIGLGLGQDTVGRRYSDSPCGGAIAQSYAETAVNNLIFADDAALFASTSGFDAGISLESACDATVLHNTVVSTQAPFSSIEYRFDTTRGTVANNLVSHNVRDRGVGGPLTVAANLADAPSSCFASVGAGNLHLAAGCAAIDAADAGHTVPRDVDDTLRDSTPDIGADEFED
ncbi:MAG: right-handed parallel beta-helix repeat-containing protein [Proteobacteria bacterium]|nr:right-handed parallel beta-helix repeat-containing protein [Pseudomonadota bacterium]